MPLPEPAVLVRFREETGMGVAQIARLYGVRNDAVSRVLRRVERACAREGCENLITGSLGSKYCGQPECKRALWRARDLAKPDRKRTRKPYGQKRGTCSSCGKPVWLGKSS